MDSPRTSLRREFPELAADAIEAALAEAGGDVDAARRALQAKFYSEARAVPEERDLFSSLFGGGGGGGGADDSGLGWSLDQLAEGINTLGARLTLAGRQVAHAIGEVLPPALNPFLEEFEDEEGGAPAGPQPDVAEATRASGTAAGAVKKRGAAGGGGGAARVAAAAAAATALDDGAAAEYDGEDDDDYVRKLE